MKPVAAAKTVICRCFFCAAANTAPAPPSVIKCRSCGKDLRVFDNVAGVRVDLSRAAEAKAGQDLKLPGKEKRRGQH